MKVILDTNIILDVLLQRAPNAESAANIFELAIDNEIEALITANSVTDIFYIIAKRLGKPMARDALQHLLNIVGIVGIDRGDCQTALDLPITDFEDALVVACSIKEGITTIISNDLEFSSLCTPYVQIVSSEKYLSLFKSNL